MGPIAFDLIAGFAAGLIFALAAQDPLSKVIDPVRNRYFVVVLLFAGGAMVPAGLVLYAQYPDWSLMYLTDPQYLPPLLMEGAIVVSYVAAPVVGFIWAQRRLVAKQAPLVRGALAGTAVITGLLLLVAGDRLFGVAYYDDFHRGGSVVALHRSPLVWALMMIVFFVVFSFAFSVLQVRRHVEVMRNVQAAPASEPPRPADNEQVDTLDEGVGSVPG